jgi:hypothetical protein
VAATGHGAEGNHGERKESGEESRVCIVCMRVVCVLCVRVLCVLCVSVCVVCVVYNHRRHISIQVLCPPFRTTTLILLLRRRRRSAGQFLIRAAHGERPAPRRRAGLAADAGGRRGFSSGAWRGGGARGGCRAARGEGALLEGRTGKAGPGRAGPADHSDEVVLGDDALARGGAGRGRAHRHHHVQLRQRRLRAPVHSVHRRRNGRQRRRCGRACWRHVSLGHGVSRDGVREDGFGERQRGGEAGWRG